MDNVFSVTSDVLSAIRVFVYVTYYTLFMICYRFLLMCCVLLAASVALRITYSQRLFSANFRQWIFERSAE